MPLEHDRSTRCVTELSLDVRDRELRCDHASDHANHANEASTPITTPNVTGDDVAQAEIVVVQQAKVAERPKGVVIVLVVGLKTTTCDCVLGVVASAASARIAVFFSTLVEETGPHRVGGRRNRAYRRPRYYFRSIRATSVTYACEVPWKGPPYTSISSGWPTRPGTESTSNKNVALSVHPPELPSAGH